MKVSDYIANRVIEKPIGCLCNDPVALMLTYERPGFLLNAVKSFMDTAGIPLIVFDDGSKSEDKADELDCIRGTGTEVFCLPHRGFAMSWLNILRFAKENLKGYDSVVMLEDDIVFAKGWLDVLKSMQGGMADKGIKQGIVTCFRPHENAQSFWVELRGIKAYQSMAHTFHANMIPMEVLDRFDVLEESVQDSLKSKSGHGIDVYWVGYLAHRLKRVSFVSEQSWVAHIGTQNSLVEAQGYGPCRHNGINLVDELKGYDIVGKSLVKS